MIGLPCDEEVVMIC